MWCILVTWYRKNDELSYGDIIFSWMSLIWQIYPMSSLALFVVIIYIPSSAYQLIQMDIRLLRKLEITDEQYYARLLALKNFHALVCETVENINDCFGWIFVFSILFFFVAFITATFFLFGSEGGLKESPLIAAHIIFLFSNCFHFWVVCCASDFIRYQVPVKSYQQIYLCF